MPHKCGKSMDQGKKKISLNQQDLVIFPVVLNKRIIPLALVGYKMIIANSVLPSPLANHFVSNRYLRNNC